MSEKVVAPDKQANKLNKSISFKGYFTLMLTNQTEVVLELLGLVDLVE